MILKIVIVITINIVNKSWNVSVCLCVCVYILCILHPLSEEGRKTEKKEMIGRERQLYMPIGQTTLYGHTHVHIC